VLAGRRFALNPRPALALGVLLSERDSSGSVAMTACGALLCDHCRNPGRCCSGFGLNLEANEDDTALHLLVKLESVLHGDCQGRPMLGAPFMPLYRAADRWRFWCPLLGADGRCTDYANRPRLCSDFTAGTDALCAEYRPEPTGIVDLQADSQ
jgi:Fe-S-cluster containining protein